MLRDIIVADLRCEGLRHVPFNSAFVAILLHAFPDATVHFFSEQSHLAHVVSQDIVKNTERLRPVAVTIPGRTAGFLERLRKERQLFKQMFATIGEAPNRLLAVLGTETSTLFLLKWLARDARHFAAAQLVLHGSVRSCAGWRSRNPLKRLLDMKSALAAPTPPGLRYIVLEAPIRQTLSRVIPSLGGRIDVLPHPVIVEDSAFEPQSDVAGTVHIGFLGLASRSKGFPEFLKLVRQVRSKNELAFHCLGRLAPNLSDTGEDVLATPASKSWLPRHQFEETVRRLHYVCLPFDTEDYSFSASGVLLDAIAHQRPVIATRFPIIERLTEEYGDIGFLCEGAEEMRSVIQMIANGGGSERYANQVRNLGSARRDRAPARLAEVYRRFTEADTQSAQ